MLKVIKKLFWISHQLFDNNWVNFFLDFPYFFSFLLLLVVDCNNYWNDSRKSREMFTICTISTMFFKVNPIFFKPLFSVSLKLMYFNLKSSTFIRKFITFREKRKKNDQLSLEIGENHYNHFAIFKLYKEIVTSYRLSFSSQPVQCGFITLSFQKWR